jgi:hypothetical protein
MLFEPGSGLDALHGVADTAATLYKGGAAAVGLRFFPACQAFYRFEFLITIPKLWLDCQICVNITIVGLKRFKGKSGPDFSPVRLFFLNATFQITDFESSSIYFIGGFLCRKV